MLKDELKSSNLVNKGLLSSSLLTSSSLASSNLINTGLNPKNYTKLSVNTDSKKLNKIEQKIEKNSKKSPLLCNTTILSRDLNDTGFTTLINKLSSSLNVKNEKISNSLLKTNHSLLTKNKESCLLGHKKSSLHIDSRVWAKGNLVSKSLTGSSVLSPCLFQSKNSVNVNNKRSIEDDAKVNELINNYEYGRLTKPHEFLQTDSLIEFIELQQNENNELYKKIKKLKTLSYAHSTFLDNSLMLTKDTLTPIQRQKNFLLNMVSSSLLKQPNFKDIQDPTRKTLLKIIEPLVDEDPEFILKLALYTRRELNIRVTANFLLCVASFEEKCRPYLKRYFKSSIMLPSDWIEVAEQYQLFMDKSINFGSLPSALRKCMSEKFGDFDAYQLAKYNKEKSRNMKNKASAEFKHIRASLKDSEGNERMEGQEIIEDKYIKSINGLIINDRISFEMVIKEDCDLVKFDIVLRKLVKPAEENSGRRDNRRNAKSRNASETQEYNETIPLRLNLDFKSEAIVQKSLLKKVWSKKSDIDKVDFEKNLIKRDNYKPHNFFIDVSSKSFEFGILINGLDRVLAIYSHKKHNIPLYSITNVRVSGCNIRLKSLNIASKDIVHMDTQVSEEPENVVKQRSFTLKQLIRQLHISSPVYNVMSLLGKKYPSTFEDFVQLNLPGIFDSQKSNTRMKLPIPETWETQISMKGNKASVWEQLIDNKKLPYMAMLRNLRNMIKSGISEKHHQWVIKKLKDEGAVVNSKQFPFRFFTAYEVLDELEKEYTEYIDCMILGEKSPPEQHSRRQRKSKKDNKLKKLKNTSFNYDKILLNRYKKTLDEALKVATTFNISPIKGSTAIFLDMGSYGMSETNSAVKKLGKSVTSIGDIGALLALMFKHSCEKSNLTVFKSAYIIHKNIDLEEGTILDNMISIKELSALNTKATSSSSSILDEILFSKEHFDNLIILSCGGDGYNIGAVGSIKYLQRFLRKYRADINEDLLFVNVDLSSSNCELSQDSNFDHENDIKISGYSDSILRFVAEKGNKGQLTHVENIDKFFDLPPLNIRNNKKTESEIELPIAKKSSIILPPASRWKTIKVFISSTFRDMHTERDILTKFIFPMLRSRLAPLLINIHEIDMRWGITESESNNDQALDICLNKILDCDYFIGMLGARFGHVLSNYSVRSHPELNWLSSYPEGASITELEIECQLRKKKLRGREHENSFFYFRDGSFMDKLTSEEREHFDSESDYAREKIDFLKKRIVSRQCEVYQNYEADYLTIEKNRYGHKRAMLTNLDNFAKRVYENLYNAITKHHYEDQSIQEVIDHQGINLLKINSAYVNACGDLFSGRRSLVRNFHKLLTEDMHFKIPTSASTDASKQLIDKHNSLLNIVLVYGIAGCGKSTFLAYYFSKYLIEIESDLISKSFIYSVGSFGGSEYTIMFLKCFLIQMYQQNNFLKHFELGTIFESNDMEFLKNEFTNFLKLWSDNNDGQKFNLVIDGVDMFIDASGCSDNSFNWLPKDIPPCFNFIFSAKSTSQTKEVLEKISTSDYHSHEIKLNIFEVENLDINDKSELIRGLLNNYNKRLDETPFNNQMKLLTGKRDAVNPFYLSLACEELRVHNEFESLNSKIKELPVRLNLLLQYVLERLEKDYGKTYTNAAFMFLLCAKDGLNEQELYDLLTLYFGIEHVSSLESINNKSSLVKNISMFDRNTVPLLSTRKYLNFLQTISETFLKPRAKNQPILLKDITILEDSLRIRYGKSKTFNMQTINRIISMHYWHSIDEKFSNNWTKTNHSAYLHLPYHLCMSNCLDDLESILTDLKFIGNKCDEGLAAHLMNDYDLHQNSKSKLKLINFFGSKASNKSTRINFSQKFFDYKSFIMQKYHLLVANPKCLYQEAINQSENSQVVIDLIELLRLNKGMASDLFEWLNKENSQEELIKPPIKIDDFNDGVCSIALSTDGSNIACGTENCEIKLFSAKTASLIRTFQGHSGKINQLCFVGSNSLCSVSSDGLASLWNVKSGFRIKVLNKHNNHNVSGCSAEPNGKNLVTVGWDCIVNIWDSDDGNFLGSIRGHTRPINCVAFDPNGDRFLTGCWDSCIRIFNMVSRTRIAVLRGHKNSVRSVSYSSNGLYISSSSIDGEIKLWNSKTGINIGNLKGHSMPVNSLMFSPDSPFLITGSSDHRCKVWSGSIGKLVHVIKSDQSIPITSVCFYKKNGQYIAAGYHSGEIKIYETLNGSLTFEAKLHNVSVIRLKFTECGNYLISTANDGSIKVVLFTRNENCVLIGELIGNKKPVSGLDVNLNNIVVTGSEDSILNIYDLNKITSYYDEQYTDEYLDTHGLKPLKIKPLTISPTTSQTAHKSPITACSFNSEGYKFASSDKNASIIIWKLFHFDFSCEELLTINSAHMDWITDLQFSNTSEYILTSSNDYTLKIWNAENGKEVSSLNGHTANINSCSFQYGCAVSTCFDGTVKVWSQKGSEITTLYGHQGKVNSCDLFVKTKTDAFEIIEIDSGEDEFIDTLFEEPSWADQVESKIWMDKHMKKRINKKNFEIESVHLVTVSDDSTIRIWKPTESDSFASLESHNDKINAVALAGNDVLATASSDNSVNIWNMNDLFTNVKSGEFINKNFSKNNHLSEITSICSTKLFVFSVSSDGTLNTWSCEYDEYQSLKDLKFISVTQAHDSRINKVCVLNESDFNTVIATCSSDKRIKIWKINHSDKILRSYTTFSASGSVDHIFVHDTEKKKYFITVEKNNSRITIRVYAFIYNDSIKNAESLVCQTKIGAAISGVESIVYQVKSTSEQLLFTFTDDKIYKLCIADLLTKFQVIVVYPDDFNYKVHNKVDELKVTEKKENGSKMVWFSSVNKINGKIFAGDWKGDIYTSDENETDLRLWKSCHNRLITEMIDLNFGTYDRILSSSQDGTIKIWTENFEKQLGQYNTSSGISAMCKMEGMASNYFCFGDQMGYLNILKWHDQ